MGISEKIRIINRNLIKDERGWFLKAITGKEENLPTRTGEVYFTCGSPGQIKGLHYHRIAQEWFTLISGKALLKLEDVNTNEKLEIELNADSPVTIYVPPFIAHAFVNESDLDFILCAYTDILYDPKDTISFGI